MVIVLKVQRFRRLAGDVFVVAPPLESYGGFIENAEYKENGEFITNNSFSSMDDLNDLSFRVGRGFEYTDSVEFDLNLRHHRNRLHEPYFGAGFLRGEDGSIILMSPSRVL